MVCRKVHVARPRPSTSGGQFAGRVSASVAAAMVVAAAAPVATTFLVLDAPGGLQFRNAVQILHGFPSGPMTIPGGNGSLFEVFGVGWLGSPIMAVRAEQSMLLNRHRPAAIENARQASEPLLRIRSAMVSIQLLFPSPSPSLSLDP